MGCIMAAIKGVLILAGVLFLFLLFIAGNRAKSTIDCDNRLEEEGYSLEERKDICTGKARVVRHPTTTTSDTIDGIDRNVIAVAAEMERSGATMEIGTYALPDLVVEAARERMSRGNRSKRHDNDYLHVIL